MNNTVGNLDAQLNNIKPGRCPSPIILTHQRKEQGENQATKHTLFIRCKRRDCPVCGPWIIHTRAIEIEAGIAAFQQAGYKVVHFVGAFFEGITPDAINHTVAVFLRQVRRHLYPKVGCRVEYTRVDEKTVAGQYCTHILLAPWSYVPQDVLSCWWHRYGGGYVVSVQGISEESSSNMFNNLAKAETDGQTSNTPSQTHSIAKYLSGGNRADILSSGKPGNTKYTGTTEAGKRSIAYSRGWPRTSF